MSIRGQENELLILASHAALFQEALLEESEPSPHKRAYEEISSTSHKKPRSIPIVPRGPYTMHSPLRRDRFSSQSVCSDEVEKIFRATYPIVQRSALPSQSLPHDLSNQAKKIERWMLNQTLTIKERADIETKIDGILRLPFWTNERKLTELGVLYFYLSRDNKIPFYNGTLVEKRISEIEGEVGKLQKVHKESCPKELVDVLPSGIVTYLMRALVRMIFTPDGAFNEGGCYAVKEVLNSSIGLLISEARRVQILEVVTRLIEAPSFSAKFMNPFHIHKDLYKLIQIDLKLPADEEFAFLYVRWDLLIALFSLIGQRIYEGNCYAIAPTSNLHVQHFDGLLDLLLESLQTGVLKIEGQEIPLMPLLDSRQRFEKDFEHPLSPELAVNLTGFSLAGEAVSTDVSLPVTTMERLSLEQLMVTHFDENALYAKEIFHSLKYNCLQQLLLSIFQFFINNSYSIEDEMKSAKERLLTKLYESILDRSQGINHGSLLLQRCHNHWVKNLWLVDCRSLSSSIHPNGHIVFDYHSQGLKFNEPLNAELINIRRLFYLENGLCVPVDRISEFTQRLSLPLDTLVRENTDLKEAANWLKLYLNSQDALEDIAKIIGRVNNSSIQFHWDLYADSDSFFLAQEGGNTAILSRWGPFSNHMAQLVVFESENEESFFQRLCREIRKFYDINPDFFRHSDPQMLISSQGHAFNLNPLHFKVFWEKTDPKNAMEELMINRARKLRRKYLSVEEKEKILRKVVGDVFDAHPDFRRICDQRMNVNRFQEEALRILDHDQFIKFNDLLNINLTGIEYHIFTGRAKFKKIMETLGLNLSPRQCEAILDDLDQKADTDLSVSAAKLATMLHQACLTVLHKAIPVFKIEQVLCDQFSIPHVIDLGSLNWTGDLREEIHTEHLILMYGIAEGQFILRRKIENNELLLPFSFLYDLLEHTTLYLPTVE